jgi:hypothetical protein
LAATSPHLIAIVFVIVQNFTVFNNVQKRKFKRYKMKKTMQKCSIMFGLVMVFAGSSFWAVEQRKDENLEIIRSLAKACCLKFGFPEEKIAQLNDAPLLGPISLKRGNREVTVYQWLGNGRGDYIVQTEVDQNDGRVTVFCGYAHRDFGAWIFSADKTTKQ